MFGAEWVRPILTGIGLIVILAAFELLSVAMTAMGDTGESIDPIVEPNRAA
jgi:hypothetical protein